MLIVWVILGGLVVIVVIGGCCCCCVEIGVGLIFFICIWDDVKVGGSGFSGFVRIWFEVVGVFDERKKFFEKFYLFL